jgi:FkbM family methyltransferase
VKLAKTRFSAELRSGQLTILNVAIAVRSGTAEFWICEKNSIWNSFDRNIAGRDGCAHHAIKVETRKFAEIVAEFGVPHYLKIDIEGADRVCLEDIDPANLPRFVSIESECLGDDRSQTNESLECLKLLRNLGYSKFKLISQRDFHTAACSDRFAEMRRLVNSAAYGRLRFWGLSTVARHLTARGRLAKRHSYRFTEGSSGPWGDGTLGKWSGYEEAEAICTETRLGHFRKLNVSSYSFWYDWHATY